MMYFKQGAGLENKSLQSDAAKGPVLTEMVKI